MAASKELLALLDRRLAAFRTSRPELAGALELQGQLIRASLTAVERAEAQPFPVPREHVSARIRSGVPLLHEQPAHVDVRFAAALFRRLLQVLQQQDNPETRFALAAIIDAAASLRLDPQRLFSEAFVQHTSHLAEIALQHGLDPNLVLTVAAQAVAPLLRAYAERLLPIVARLDDGSPEGAVWQRGYCPICGSWPTLADPLGSAPVLFLRCAACGSGWRAQRDVCPYCSSAGCGCWRPLTIEGEAPFRVFGCERCQGYVKVSAGFDPPSPELIALDDAVSTHLDLVAIQRGYHRPGGTGFMIELAVPEDEWVEELA
ncbi:MAG: formate dehydrogenase accessory protein FdhE [Chloroflexota bacterium]